MAFRRSLETGGLLPWLIRPSLSRTAGWMSVMDGPDVCEEKGGEYRLQKTSRLVPGFPPGFLSGEPGPVALE
jgi:hypothetical protein